jgi:hypothetical protein
MSVAFTYPDMQKSYPASSSSLPKLAISLLGRLNEMSLGRYIRGGTLGKSYIRRLFLGRTPHYKFVRTVPDFDLAVASQYRGLNSLQ